MSTDYEIRCACGDRYTRDNWRDAEDVNVLLSLRAAFATIGKALPPNFHLDGWSEGMFPGIFDFFAEHEGHELSIYDEYGSRWPECPDGQHTLERLSCSYVRCTVCVYRDFTEVAS